jgi:hypothetical protein
VNRKSIHSTLYYYISFSSLWKKTLWNLKEQNRSKRERNFLTAEEKEKKAARERQRKEKK